MSAAASLSAAASVAGFAKFLIKSDRDHKWRLTAPLCVWVPDWGRYPALARSRGWESQSGGVFAGGVEIFTGYLWDGASLAPDGVASARQKWWVRLLQRAFRGMLPASCAHDFVYENLEALAAAAGCSAAEIRADADLLFGDLLASSKTPARRIAYSAVRAAGGICHEQNKG
jgi:hypothetical protein